MQLRLYIAGTQHVANQKEDPLLLIEYKDLAENIKKFIKNVEFDLKSFLGYLGSSKHGACKNKLKKTKLKKI